MPLFSLASLLSSTQTNRTLSLPSIHFVESNSHTNFFCKNSINFASKIKHSHEETTQTYMHTHNTHTHTHTHTHNIYRRTRIWLAIRTSSRQILVNSLALSPVNLLCRIKLSHKLFLQERYKLFQQNQRLLILIHTTSTDGQATRQIPVNSFALSPVNTLSNQTLPQTFFARTV